MSDLSSETPRASSEIESLRRELAEESELVQSIRKELILSQITVLELQDTILQKETDQADAVSILGQAELVLEGKINYIFELDRVLNERLAAAQKELSDTREAHQSITDDLVQKLDATNRALGDAHQLAAKYARDAAQTGEKLAAALTAIKQRDGTIQLLEAALLDGDASATSLREENVDLSQKLEAALDTQRGLEKRLTAIHQSFAWKITSPFRSNSDKSDKSP
jgi:chromosome segregation ATPase